MIWFTSDLHIGHENILKFCNRPFNSLQEMHMGLIKNFNSVVRSEDTIYFLGDVAMGHQSTLTWFLKSLNTTKLMCIKGNHDAGITSLLNSGFNAVLYNATIYIAKQRVTMSHCPLLGVKRENTEGMRGAVSGENFHGEYKHQKYSMKNEGQLHLHGHCHSVPEKRMLGKMLDVGVDAWGYKPVSFNEIDRWVQKTTAKEQKENESKRIIRSIEGS